MRSTLLSLLLIISLAVPVHGGTVLSGKVTGPDGKEMVKAIALLKHPFDTTTIRLTAAGADGRYSLDIPSRGVWIAIFKGVHCADHEVAVYVDKERRIGLDVNLGTYNYMKKFDNVRAIGSFNNWYTPSAVQLKRQPGGEYSATVNTSAKSVSYRLLGVREGGSIEGNQSGDYAYEGSRGYVSVIAAEGGTARIVFDPRKDIPPGSSPKVRFIGAQTADRFNKIYRERVNFENAFRTAFREQIRSRGRDPQNIRFDFSGAVSSIESQLRTEKVPVLRQELYFNYLRIYIINQRLAPSLYTKVLNEIPPASPVWALGANNIYYALSHSDLAEDRRDDYVGRIISENPVRRVKSIVLYDEFMEAKMKEDKTKEARYFDLLTEKYGDTPEGSHASKMYGGSSQLSNGNKVPSFSLVSSDKMVQHITDKTLRGKYSLIVFWAARDPGSVDEIGYLEKIRDMYKPENLNIFTISVDSSYSDVARFREKRYMPWMNAYVGKDRDSKVVKAFRVYEIPKVFLVGPNGVILESGKPLIGNELEKTLMKYMRK